MVTLPTPRTSEILRLHASLADLATTPQDGYRYELLGGVLFRMPPPQEEHGQISSLIIEALAPYCRAHGIRAQLVADIGYQLRGSLSAPPTVLAPDVSIFRVPKAAGMTYSTDAPLLAVEIASPSQGKDYLRDKAELYLAAGTALVWVVWPDARTVDAWVPAATMTTLHSGDALGGGTALPGLLIPVASIFP